MSIQNNNKSSGGSVIGLNTATAIQSLTPDPIGKYLYVVQDPNENREYHVRANNHAEAWTKIRKYKHNGEHINTALCTIGAKEAAFKDAPEIFVTPMER